ncbi:hypothetical protein [Indiicoccus explosivorum]|uniref:hypothetical protein n=1 Tax=Indiicoccus explosivorum TaxID=1917864 RepID=UPI001F4D85BA|nr:hypothetical protein [Indiicoccus explosivorum]
MKKIACFLVQAASAASMALWIILVFFNPYSAVTEYEPIVNTFFMLFLPAVLALLSIFKSKKSWLFAAFLWSLPISLYLAGTPGIFAFFGLTSLAYLIGFILLLSANKQPFPARKEVE